MKNVKFLWLCLFTLAISSIYAQEQSQNPEQRIEKKVQKLSAALNLSPAQMAEVQNLELQLLEKRAANRDAKRAAAESKRATKKAALRAEMATVLSTEQMTRYDAYVADKEGQKDMRKQKQKRGKSNKGNRKGQGQERFAALSEALQLNEAQKPQVQAILESFKSAAKEERQAMKAEYKAEKAAKDEAMKAILTPEQFSKYLTLKEERKGKRGKKGRKN